MKKLREYFKTKKIEEMINEEIDKTIIRIRNSIKFKFVCVIWLLILLFAGSFMQSIGLLGFIMSEISLFITLIIYDRLDIDYYKNEQRFRRIEKCLKEKQEEH